MRSTPLIIAVGVAGAVLSACGPSATGAGSAAAAHATAGARTSPAAVAVPGGTAGHGAAGAGATGRGAAAGPGASRPGRSGRAGGSDPARMATQPPPRVAAGAARAAVAPCTARGFLPVLRRRYDTPATKLRIAHATVIRCRGRYARVLAVPDPKVCHPGVGYCYETEQVFLRSVGGRWQILFSGTGVTCRGETNAQVRRICQALGYPA